MASCNFGGASSVNLLATSLNFNNTKSFRLYNLNGKIFGGQGLQLVLSRQRAAYSSGLHRKHEQFRSPMTAIAVRCSSKAKSQPQDVSQGKKKISETNKLISSSEVESLLASICDTSSITEFKLTLGGFQLCVKRNVADQASTSSPPSLPPAIVDNTSNDTPYQNGSATSSSLAIIKAETGLKEIQRSNDANSDEALVMLPSPKVGLFRRSRTIKGKRAPPPCKEKQEVKEGQVLCYIEQLSGVIPIESDISGEVVKILREDGEPVGYGDALIAILPSFPGIKKLQLPA